MMVWGRRERVTVSTLLIISKVAFLGRVPRSFDPT